MEERFEKMIPNGVRTVEEALYLAQDVPEADLFCVSKRIREHFFGNEVQLCSIINTKSGQCDMDCRFCSQSRYNSTAIKFYPLIEKEKLKQQIRDVVSTQDRHCGLVTSGGKLSGKELDALTDTVCEISGGGLAPVCASLGRLAEDDFVALKKAGVTRFHHNLESSENYYPEVCSTQSWQQRLETVQVAQSVGLEVCCGGLFGLGESWRDRIDLAFTLKELGVNSVPINFLYAHEGTPMHDSVILSASDALRIIAVYRLILPDSILRICGGRMHVLGERQNELFDAGANGLMTGDYLTVAGSQYEADLAMIRALGLHVGSGGLVSPATTS